MKKIKVLSVFGTRPEAAKMCPLVREMAGHAAIESQVCVTAQHREMLDQVMESFGVRADFDLNIMREAQTLTDIMVRALPGIGQVLEQARPDIVLAHGDTSTAFAAALAAFYAKIPVGHVEAGLRSFDRTSPYPEEVNRVLVDQLAQVYFAPTHNNAENLRREGLLNNIFVTGNTVIDGLRYTVREDYRFEAEALNRVAFGTKKVITLTAHRRENYGRPMENIFAAVAQLARDPQVQIVYPVHPSPYVQQTAHSFLGQIENVLLAPAIGVADMHNLMSRSAFVMTDSGGLQEEAPALGKPVVVLRRETERPEAVAAGTVAVVGVETEPILNFAQSLLGDSALYGKMARAVNPYGDGRASARIVQDLLFHFGLAPCPAPDFTAGV